MPLPICACSKRWSTRRAPRCWWSTSRRRGARQPARAPAAGRRRRRYRPAVPRPADLLSPDGAARADRRGVPPAPRHAAGRSGISPHPDRGHAADDRHPPARASRRQRLCGAAGLHRHYPHVIACSASSRRRRRSSRITIEELQSANEELETTNEELQSTNEELETTNEELQSTNEELETLNEEARSANEEMESVNEELRIQAEQAASYRLYLESVLRAMNGGIIVHRPETLASRAGTVGARTPGGCAPRK